MEATKGDICVLSKRTDEKIAGLTILQVDDSYLHGGEGFLAH